MKTKNSTIPTLTYQQRIAYLNKANRLRHERMKICKDLACGNLSAVEVILRADEGNEACSGMRVKQFIGALPGYGLKKTQQVMQTVGIADNRRLGGLGIRQMDALIHIL